MRVCCTDTLLIVNEFRDQRADDREPATGPLPPGTPGDVQPPAYPVSPAPSHPEPYKPHDPERSAFLRSSLLAAGIGTAAFFIGGIFAMAGAAAVQPFVFLLMIATGGVAVTLYTHKMHSGIGASKGFRLGLLTGFFGAVMLLVISMLGLISHNSRDEFRKTVTDAMNQSAASSADPAAHDMATRLTSSISTTGGLITFLLLMMSLVGVIYLILSGIGGAVGASLFGRSPRRDL